jgi:3-(3-hydroxy-phenyl)propionate hydroxylase
MQYRSREGVIAQFNFGYTADLTRHPFRTLAEQFKLNKIIYAILCHHPNFCIEFDRQVVSLSQNDDSITVGFADGTQRRGRWLIGADGARSGVRRGLSIDIEEVTWPERFLVVSTPYDFSRDFPDLSPISYVADPVCWLFLPQVPGFWRVMFPIDPETEDGTAMSCDYAQGAPRSIVPGAGEFEIGHVWRAVFVHTVPSWPVMPR